MPKPARDFAATVQQVKSVVGQEGHIVKMLRTMIPEEAEQVVAALSDPSLSAAQLSRALRQWGFTISASSVSNWRNSHA